MSTKILIAYASKYGSTAEIARKIGDVLTEKNLSVDVIPADEVKDLNQYAGVVLGSAVYIGSWRKEAAKFLEKYKGRLSELPLWIFSSGPAEEGDPVELLKGWKFPEKLKPIIDEINPRDITVFHGVFDMDKLNKFDRWIAKKVDAKSDDYRDWAAIEKWAAAIAGNLKVMAAA